MNAVLAALVFNFDDFEHIACGHVAFGFYKSTGDDLAMLPNCRTEVNGDGVAIGRQ